ncbi:MAG: cache domain-containing protein [Gammaproteobacteria bacterium]|nr:cache domain-containing protein [Gammaproteobacteria bacterium]
MRANDGSEYSKLHGDYHAWFKKIRQKWDLYDLFLIDRDGNICYTVFKEDDFGINIIEGKYKHTKLANTVLKALSADGFELYASEFDLYQPSNNIPASFIAVPVFENAKLVGALAVQIRLDTMLRSAINSFEEFSNTQYEVVNSDRFIAMSSKINLADSLKQKTENLFAEHAINGAYDTKIFTDDLGNHRLIAYTYPSFMDHPWAIILQSDRITLLNVLNDMGQRLALLVVGLLVLFGLFIGSEKETLS